MPQSVIAGLRGNCIFSFIRNHRQRLWSGCTTVLQSQRTLLAFGVPLIFTFSFTMGVRWNSLVFACVSLTAGDVECFHVLICAICLSE